MGSTEVETYARSAIASEGAYGFGQEKPFLQSAFDATSFSGECVYTDNAYIGGEFPLKDWLSQKINVTL